ncbi:hypothetical protein IE81DRAFT_323780 [Ceraceosorus guamensis]|uniref:Uncharacterized protein n=1 Tax=Ceraceosorus guamensis TaxID=1522189 RepID=A0A316VXF2_9BASI|nr:hypothetical protein IE81DRAFT_323780 [Ceraceosorus guamensis]PWN42132.1 hypothetical protein IE81DRAFT_323780 [Ceraceosorus guamensis]
MVNPTSGPSLVSALLKSSRFVQKVQGDLLEARQVLKALREEQEAWQESSRQLISDEKGENSEDPTRWVDLGAGLSIEVHNDLESRFLPVVQSGLPHADLLIEMDHAKAVEFCNKKAAALGKQAERSEAKVAQIEAHLYLATQSAAQLEAIRSGQENSLLDGLQIPNGPNDTPSL